MYVALVLVTIVFFGSAEKKCRIGALWGRSVNWPLLNCFCPSSKLFGYSLVLALPKVCFATLQKQKKNFSHFSRGLFFEHPENFASRTHISCSGVFANVHFRYQAKCSPLNQLQETSPISYPHTGPQCAKKST